MFCGFVELGGSLSIPVQALNASKAPANADALPAYRVYGQSGLITGQTGSAAIMDTGNLSDASFATPIVVTSNGHGLTNGTRVTVAGVLGNTNANGTFTVANVTTNTFELEGSAGNGAYTSGGTWNVAGLYEVNLTASEVNGYASGQTYQVLVSYEVGGDAFSQLFSFTVA
jgi:hypothetical protein